MNEAFFQFAVMHFIFVISPGATFIFLVSNGLKFGMKNAMYNLIGTVIGYAITVILCIVGIIEILYEFPILHHFIKYAGSSYLLFKAWKIWKNSDIISESSLNVDNGIQNFKKNMIITGFKVSITNPQQGINIIALLTCFSEYDITFSEKLMITSWMIVGYFTYFYILLKIFTNNYIRSIVMKKIKIIERILAIMLAVFAIKIAI